MISQLQIYIGKTLLQTTLMIVLLILGVDFLFGLVHELGEERGGYTTVPVFIYTICTIPRRVYELFPMSSLIGAILGLGLLATHSELIVMRAAGVSVAKITGWVLKVSLVLAIIMALMGEFLVPRAEYAAEALKVHTKSRGQAVLTVKGAWVRDDDMFIHIQYVLPDGRLKGITRYIVEDQELTSASTIREARYKKGRWTLTDIQTSLIFDNEVKTQKIEQEVIKEWIDPSILEVLFTDPDDLSVQGLWQYIHYLKENKLDYSIYALAFWKKILQPLAVVVMVFLAVPFVFGPLRSASMGLRLLAGILFGFGFLVLNEVLGPLSVIYSLPAFAAAIIPLVLFAGLGVWMMRKIL